MARAAAANVVVAAATVVVDGAVSTDAPTCVKLSATERLATNVNQAARCAHIQIKLGAGEKCAAITKNKPFSALCARALSSVVRVSLRVLRGGHVTRQPARGCCARPQLSTRQCPRLKPPHYTCARAYTTATCVWRARNNSKMQNARPSPLESLLITIFTALITNIII